MTEQTCIAGIARIGSGCEVSYLTAGAGEAVVLLHGVGSAARSWQSQLDSVPSGYRLIAWDAPGYGASTKLSSSAPVPKEYADSLQAFVSALNLSKFHLVGHSLGSLIATCYARHYPDRILSLTLASIAPGHARLPESERVRLRNARLEALEKWGARGMAEARGPALLSAEATESMRRAVVDTMATIRPDGWKQAVLMLSQGDTRGDLAEVPEWLPVQIIFGSEDTITPPESNLRTAEARPRVPIHVIGGAGHAVYLEKASEFNRILYAFLNAHQPERTLP